MGSCLTKSDEFHPFIRTVYTDESDCSEATVKAYGHCPEPADPPQYDDEYVKYISEGGSLTRLMEMYRPSCEWDEELRRRFPVGFFCEKQSDGRVLHCCVIHLNDDLDTTKRHFLSFYNLKVHEMHPEEFMQWCIANQMPNTCTDYVSLYSVSRFRGENSSILRNISRSRYVVRIYMSDRFFTHNGRYRALLFQATTKQGIYWVFSAFMSRLDPESYRYVRCATQPYATETKVKR